MWNQLKWEIKKERKEKRKRKRKIVLYPASQVLSFIYCDSVGHRDQRFQCNVLRFQLLYTQLCFRVNLFTFDCLSEICSSFFNQHILLQCITAQGENNACSCYIWDRGPRMDSGVQPLLSAQIPWTLVSSGSCFYKYLPDSYLLTYSSYCSFPPPCTLFFLFSLYRLNKSSHILGTKLKLLCVSLNSHQRGHQITEFH